MAGINNLEDEIKEYCEVNGISDVKKFTQKCTMVGFNIERFGFSPVDNIKRQNDVIEKEGEQNSDEPIVVKKKKITITRK